MPEPSCGEIWPVDLNPVRGHEQAGRRPGLVISVDGFNYGPAGLVVIIPITTKAKGIPFHVEVHPPEGGLDRPSFINTDFRTGLTVTSIEKFSVPLPEA